MTNKPCCMKTRKKHLLERFEKYDKNPHTDYRQIAFNIAYDYHKQTIKIYELEQKIKNILHSKQ